MLHDRVLALRRANIYEPHYYRHLVSGTHLVWSLPGGVSIPISRSSGP